jgi:hypothetical protein
MKYAETGQLYRRNRAQQPAFLGHDGLRKPALKQQRTGGYFPALLFVHPTVHFFKPNLSPPT